MAANNADVGALYRLPLDEFTEARDRIAGELASKGDKAAAVEVKSLRKPSVAAWAVNRLADEHSEDMARLLDLREQLEEAASAQEMRRLASERRDVTSQLVARARAILERDGHAASASTLEKVTRTLQAGETDEERDLLRAGRLTREMAPSGFGDFGFVLLDAAEEPSEEDTAPRRKAEELAVAAARAEREAAELERAAARAEQAAGNAAKAAAAARRKAESARARADKAVADL
ncbi:MAG: hypothetical protein ACRDJV_07265 [Actinomycetota bacterium]